MLAPLTQEYIKPIVFISVHFSASFTIPYHSNPNITLPVFMFGCLVCDNVQGLHFHNNPRTRQTTSLQLHSDLQLVFRLPVREDLVCGTFVLDVEAAVLKVAKCWCQHEVIQGRQDKAVQGWQCFHQGRKGLPHLHFSAGWKATQLKQTFSLVVNLAFKPSSWIKSWKR